VTSPFDARPIIVALAGPNGAGKSTFYHAHLAPAGLRFLNADDLARGLSIDASEAMQLANRVRQELLEQGESFVFETVLSDPVGDKVEFLGRAAARGYTVLMIFIGLEDADISEQRVAIRVMQGGLPHVLVFDNSDLAHPLRRVAEFRDGKLIPGSANEPIPRWLRAAAGSG